MSLRKQLAMAVSLLLLIIFMLLMAFDGRQSRNYLNEQLSRTAQDAATSLALSMQASWQVEPDIAILRSLADAQFDRGLYQSLTLQRPDGSVLVERNNTQLESSVPAWFQRLHPLNPAAGVAELSDGWRTLAVVSLDPHPGLAYVNLWNRFGQVALALGLGGLIAVMLVYALIGRLFVPLNRIRRQTEDWAVGNFRAMPDCAVPEVQPLVDSLNRTNYALADLMTGLQGDLETSRRQNDLDPVTGLLNREAYLRQLKGILDDAEGTLGAVFMMRVVGMSEMNESLGHAQTDTLLRQVADQLSVIQPQGAAMGRMNGADWSMLIMGMDASAAREHCARLAHLWADQATEQALVVQVVATPLRDGMTLPDVFSRLDRGLIEGLDDPWIDESRAMPGGRKSWARYVAQVWAAGEVSFDAIPVIDQTQGTRYELLLASLSDDEGQIIGAPSFIPVLAELGRLYELDQAAISEAIVRAGDCPQGVTLSLDSLMNLDRLTRYIQQIGAQASEIRIEFSEADLVACADRWNQLEPVLRAYPNWVLKHAGLHGGTVDLVRRFQPSAVKLANGLIQGAMDQGDPRGIVRTTSHLLRTLRCKVWAEGVSDQATWDWVMAQGLDGGQGRYASSL